MYSAERGAVSLTALGSPGYAPLGAFLWRFSRRTLGPADRGARGARSLKVLRGTSVAENDLAEMVVAWPRLQEGIRRAILVLVG